MSFLSNPAIWFMIFAILIIVAAIIYWAVEQHVGVAFWIVLAVGIILFIMSIVALIFNRSGKSKPKKKAPVVADEDLY